MNILIIGGTSGLGLELAQLLHNQSNKVYVVGRHQTTNTNLHFISLDLSDSNLAMHSESLVKELPQINTLIYSAGFFQEGRITDLQTQEIERMLDVGVRGLVYFARALLAKQDYLDEMITITSSSQWTPRKLEPMYNLVKAGAAHFSNALSEDERIGKVLVIGPAGMRTPFWDGIERADLDEMLDPKWVAHEILQLRQDDYQYRFAKILRQPARVEIVETRS